MSGNVQGRETPGSSEGAMDRKEIIQLLHARGSDQDELWDEARKSRERSMGNNVVVRGVVEVTNVCRVNCGFCPMRRDNTRANERFQLSSDGILGAARAVASAGIDVFFLQGGEIPQTTRLVGEVLPDVRAIFNDDVEILLNLGIKPRHELEYLRERGADSYILKHETSDPDLALSTRGETLEHRLKCLDDLIDLGYKVGTGGIVGLPGQKIQSIADDILLARDMGASMCSFAPFRPAPDTPLASYPPGDVDTTLNAIAVSRLLSPNWLIPSVSALEATVSGGQQAGLNAGANVLTVNFSARSDRDKYLIYGKDRFVVDLSHVEDVIALAGCERRGSTLVRGRACNQTEDH